MRATVRGNDATNYFRQEYGKLSTRARRKLAYHRKFVLCSSVSVRCVGGQTAHDGDYDHYAQILREETARAQAQA